MAVRAVRGTPYYHPDSARRVHVYEPSLCTDTADLLGGTVLYVYGRLADFGGQAESTSRRSLHDDAVGSPSNANEYHDYHFHAHGTVVYVGCLVWYKPCEYRFGAHLAGVVRKKFGVWSRSVHVLLVEKLHGNRI